MAGAQKRISVREETFEALERVKDPGDSWDDVIRRLLESRQIENRSHLLERTDNDEYVPLEDA